MCQPITAILYVLVWNNIVSLGFAFFQGVHESRGVSEEYLKLESLVQKVVSPYLGTHGLCSGDGTDTHCCVLGETL